MKRREFLSNSLAASVLPVFLNGFSLSGLGNLGIENDDDDKVLVVIQLSGGNDGLNTVIPLSAYSNYKNARANIAIEESKLIRIPQSDTVGLHPAMASLAEMFKNGEATLIHDVGYPKPDFSHFRASDIWNSASDADKYVTTGWAGRYLSTLHPTYPENYPDDSYPDPLAIQIGSFNSVALQGPLYTMGMSISDPANFYSLIENRNEDAPDTRAGKELSYLRSMAFQSNRYSETIKYAAARVTKQKDYPVGSLGAQMKIVARLIGGGLRTKIYYVNIGGFDTHASQTDATDTSVGAHANILKQLSDNISAFYADLKALGVAKKVVGMTYSEFGRRVKSNASSGTDHGAAAPMFLFGESLNSGVLGKSFEVPSVVPADLNVPMQYDFRSVYASILKNWFCLPSSQAQQVLFSNFQDLPLFKSGACGEVKVVAEKSEAFRNYPNPFNNETTFTFNSAGGNCMIQIFDTLGREVLVPLNADFEKGYFTETLDLRELPKGMYMARFQNNHHQEVIRILKG